MIDTAVFPGTAISFSSTLSLPYVEVAGVWRRGEWLVDGRLGSAPLVTVEQEDDHLFRQLRAEADLEGTAWFAEVGVSRELSRGWFVRGSFQAFAMEADGEADNLVYGSSDPDVAPGESWTIDQETESSTFAAFLELGCRL